MTIGLIGYGRFGQFAAKHLSRRAPVVVYDRRRLPRALFPPGVRRGTFAEVSSQPVVVLAVPVSALREVLHRMRRHLQPGGMVIDVLAVKSEPLRWMKEILPPETAILGTHPFFGPDSAGKNLRGFMVVICPARVDGRRLARVLSELHRAGLETVLMNPGEHDRLMAETILLTQYVGRMVARAVTRVWPAVTPNYSHLLSIVETVRHDTAELYADMARFNPAGRSLLRNLRQAHRTLERDAHHVKR